MSSVSGLRHSSFKLELFRFFGQPPEYQGRVDDGLLIRAQDVLEDLLQTRMKVARLPPHHLHSLRIRSGEIQLPRWGQPRQADLDPPDRLSLTQFVYLWLLHDRERHQMGCEG